MIGRKFKIGTGLAVAVAATIAVFPTMNAYADYAPTSNDVVGVGSDTLQQLGDFVADGDFLGDPGYNAGGNKNKFISVDATADTNTRLAYGPQGLGPNCAPGTGPTVGTGNSNAQHADAPCTLNPSVLLRAGKSPTQRPNGSGAGYNLLKADTNTGTGKGLGYVDFARASSPRGVNALFDSVQVGNDPLAMLTSSTTNAVAVTTAQLKNIYECTTTDWATLGGTAGTIKPLLPQVGSGTRTSFLSAISVTTPGLCVTNVEENDPEAIDSSGSAANAIEPMSLARLNLFQGKLSDGTSNGVGGYFKDPSCSFPTTESSTSPAACQGATATLAPNVKFWDSTTNPTAFQITRPLYIYFRHADIDSTKKFQPTSALNWVRTMLYNPCPTPGAPTCVTIAGTEYGPGGQPFVATAQGQAVISASGVIPAYAYTAAGP
jgi:hypothetical protein